MGVSQKTKIELPYDPATSLPGIYLEKKKKKKKTANSKGCMHTNVNGSIIYNC